MTDDFLESVRDAESGLVIIFDETGGTPGIGRTDLAARLASRLEGKNDE